MARILLNIDDLNHFKFKEAVGEGQMSEMLREFIYTYNKTNTTNNLDKEISETEEHINKLQFKLITLTTQRDKILKIEEQAREQMFQEQEELYSFDPFAHLDGKTKINEIQRCIYRVEKGKFIPEWATQRNPENPQEYALKVLKKLNKGE